MNAAKECMRRLQGKTLDGHVLSLKFSSRGRAADMA
eukprot:CAMPEP_0198351424 /NCGR_PEP_ID=MMETSP1450-20131203/102793_1 /TAXON_ID=753684 ORGANISM="Madagascaria erythrocladiodes, Strain CCMP3234" /NCGR_SAMPLE_ID=MMETSP1450 /ASSEMBLY_ACC=CAM_ASM_001115 /LENGTH=35 /DNA_ID= /DNA_START= /DNA_END= /DNA_ORIENTATION=